MNFILFFCRISSFQSLRTTHFLVANFTTLVNNYNGVVRYENNIFLANVRCDLKAQTIRRKLKRTVVCRTHL